MNKRLLAIIIFCILIALFASCASGPPTRLVEHETRSDVRQAYMQAYWPTAHRIGGFIHWDGDTCVIHYSLEAPDRDRCIRHEYDHCLYGPWHGHNITSDC